MVVVNFEVIRRTKRMAFKNTKDIGEVSKGIGIVQGDVIYTWICVDGRM